MIFVAVGTHHQPFDRLLRAADAAAAALEEPLVAQRGVSRLVLRGQVYDLLPPDAFEALVREARVVVFHGGSSSFLQARALGRRPIVVPRRPEHHEHVDDHQVRFVNSLDPQEAVVAEPEGLFDALRNFHEGRRPVDDTRTQRFCAAFDALVETLWRP